MFGKKKSDNGRKRKEIIGEDGKIYVEKKKSNWWKWVLGLFAIAVIGSLLDGSGNENNNASEPNPVKAELPKTTTTVEVTTTKETTTTEEPTTTTISEAERKASEEEMIANTDWKSISWEELMRNSEDYPFSAVEVQGEVQVVQKDGKDIFIQLKGDGDVDQPFMISTSKDDLESNVLEGDWLTVKGYFLQLLQYETVLGAQKEAPLVVAEKITIN
ncbi:hypothetical protein ACQV2X_05375 [Facklamia sp. P12945]|uniref:hypothetical protein n=1 Tax=Facklamia sp. P12945 TaxID=3421950 RepID=UPI003D182256